MEDTTIRGDVVDLQLKVAQQEVLVSRFDTALDKISEVSLNVSKLLAVHEQRLEAQEEISRSLPNLIEARRHEMVEQVDAIYDRISSTEQGLRQEMANGQKEILVEIKSLRTDMTELGNELKDQSDELKKDLEDDFATQMDNVTGRVSKLERLSWIVIGGATVIGFILSQALGILEFGLN